MRKIRRGMEAALAAALFCSCVSVEEHRGLTSQLAVEQARVQEQERQIRGLKQAIAKQSHDLRNLKLEREELGDRLSEARKLVPAVADVARDVWEAAPVRGPERVLAGTISFAPGSQKLSEEDLDKLSAIAEEIAARGYTAILVEGHSDPTPLSEKSPFQSNMHLSTVRALAVYHALVGMPGVDAARVRVAGYSEFGPRPGREKSERRVEVRYLPAAKKP